ncbi:MAG: c-type cytochrome [Arcobacteraceae bacterium]
MKYIIIIGITLIVTLLVSKLLMAVELVHFNKFGKEASSNLTKTEQLINIGKSTYLVHCTSCHGKDGKGNKEKAHNHTKRIAKKSVLDVINNGSNNLKSIYPSGMPAGLLKEDEAKEVAKYVANDLNGKKPKGWKTCSTCHDDSGEGINLIAPNIKNYSDDLVMTVLTNGKKGVIGTMPNFKDSLSIRQMKALAAYIRSIQIETK